MFCFCKIADILNFLYKDAESGRWERFIMHHFYEKEENIDNLYLGSSHLYCAVNPLILDEKNEEVNFNLSTGSQKFSESYLLLQEADKRHDIRRVYLEMYYSVHTEDYLYTLQNHFRLLDEIKNSWAKQQLIWELDPEEEMMAVYLPFVRYRQEIFNIEYIKKQINEKSKADYREYRYCHTDENGTVEYIKNGFMSMNKILSAEDLVFECDDMSENPISDDAMVYLKRIIDYCKENNIELMLFSAPVYELQIYGTANYDAYVNQVKKVAEENALKYYDFNLCKETFLPIQRAEYFSDLGHLNSKGAELFSEVFYDVVTNDRGDYFYDSYEEKIEKSKPSVYGVLSKKVGETNFSYTIAATKEGKFEYRIDYFSDKEKEWYMIQDYSENKVFHSSNETEGCFVIRIRKVGEKEDIMELKIVKEEKG